MVWIDMNKKREKKAFLTITQKGEEGLIRLIQWRMAKVYGPGVIRGIGDDSAVLRPPGGSLLATVDILVEGIHFRREFSSFQDVGYKALAVNISDIAAMGGTPLYALISLALPRREPLKTVEKIYQGLETAAKAYGVSIVGGNLSAHKGGVIIDVTLLGQATSKRILYRRGAKAGDILLVTGYLGEAALGLMALKKDWRKSKETAPLIKAYRQPRPLIAEGQWLAQQGYVHAMIDLSDGLAKDLGHLCRESQLGAIIYEEKIPLSSCAQNLARRLRIDPLPLAWGGGEDYQLLIAVTNSKAEELQKKWKRKFDLPLTWIGQMLKPSWGITMMNTRGKKRKLAGGYRHF